MDARLEAFLDGTLPAADREACAAALRADPAWQAELALARRIRQGLHALPVEPCPPAVTAAVLAHARRHAAPPWPERLAAWIDAQAAVLGRPVLAMAVLVLVVVAASLVGRPQPAPQTLAAASEAEVEQALAEVRWTLAYLSEVGRQTGRSVRRDVLEERVVAPVHEAIAAPRSRFQDHQR